MITIGTELLLGTVADTNSQAVAQELADIGIYLSHFTTVGDDLDDIVEALDIALARSDLLILSGGLGPTEDDRTRDAVAKGTGHDLVFHDDLMTDIEAFFERRGFRMVPSIENRLKSPEGLIPSKIPSARPPVLSSKIREASSLPFRVFPENLNIFLDPLSSPFSGRDSSWGGRLR